MDAGCMRYCLQMSNVWNIRDESNQPIWHQLDDLRHARRIVSSIGVDFLHDKGQRAYTSPTKTFVPAEVKPSRFSILRVLHMHKGSSVEGLI
jgi:hypothetical protein